MEAVGVEAVRVGVEVAQYQRVVDLRADLVLQPRCAARHGQGRSRHERDAKLDGAVVHPARVVPRVREVLVAENGYRPPGEADHPAHLLEEVPARVHLPSALVGGVVAVLGDDEGRRPPQARRSPIPARSATGRASAARNVSADRMLGNSSIPCSRAKSIPMSCGWSCSMYIETTSTCDSTTPAGVGEPLHEPRYQQVGMGAVEERGHDCGDLLACHWVDAP